MDQVTEKDLMTDLLQTQRFVSASYNGKASETKSIALKEDLLKILGDEQLCLSLIFDAMDRRGWYQTQPAKQQDIQNAISKFNNPQVFTAMEQVLQPQYQISKEATTMYGQTFPTNVLHDYTQTRGDYGYGQQGYAGAGIGAAGAGMGAAGAGMGTAGAGMGTAGAGMGTAGAGIGAAGFGAQGAFGQAGGYQGMGATGVGFQGGGVGYQGAGWGGQAGLGYQGAGVGYQGAGVGYQGAGVGYQGAGWGGQAGVGYGGVTYPVGGIMNAAAQSLQSNFPGLRSAVMSDWTQSRPDVYGYQGAYVAPYQTQFQAQQPQFGFQGQIPQAGFPAQNVLATFQQTRLDPGLGTRGFGAGAGYGVGNIGGVGAGNIGGVGAGNIGGVGVGATGGWGAGGGIGGYGTGFGGTTMGTTMGTPAGGIYGGGIMNAAANTLQSNIGNLRGSVLNDWSLTSPENQNEFLAQQRQFGTTQIGATPTGLQAQVIQSQPYAQRNVAGLAGTSTWAGAGLSGTAGYTGGIQVQ